MTDFREEGTFLLPPHPRAAPKMLILNRVKIESIKNIQIIITTIADKIFHIVKKIKQNRTK